MDVSTAEPSEGEGLSLLQTAAMIRTTAPAVATPDPAASTHPTLSEGPGHLIRVWCPGRDILECHILEDATFQQVKQILAAVLPGASVDGIAPAFPQLPGPMQCVLSSQDGTPVVLVHVSADKEPVAAAIAPRTTAPQLAKALYLPNGRFLLEEQTWFGSTQGCFHGMRLHFVADTTATDDGLWRALPTPCRQPRQRALREAVGETIPRLEVPSVQNGFRTVDPVEPVTPAGPAKLLPAPLLPKGPSAFSGPASGAHVRLGVTLELGTLESLQLLPGLSSRSFAAS